LRYRKKPKDDKRKHGMLLEAFKSLAKLAIDNGDDDAFGHAFARIMQTTKEVQDKVAQKTELVNDPSITPYPPMMQRKLRYRRKKPIKRIILAWGLNCMGLIGDTFYIH
jgi:hypothetical protein